MEVPGHVAGMEQALAVAPTGHGHQMLVVVVLLHKSVDFHKNVVAKSDLVVGQLLVEVPDLDDLPKSIFLLSKIKGSYPLPHLILTTDHKK